MEKQKLFLIGALSVLYLLAQGNAIEKPQYQIVHEESDFEVRLYTESTWMSATITKLSFEKATFDGFHRLFQYIEGVNLNWTRVPMTAPVVTSIVPGAGPFQSSAYSVRFYLPVDFQADPPVPFPELHLKPYVWDTHCVTVRKFSGFANDDNIAQEAKKLASSLSRSPLANITLIDSDYAYSIAQYDPPFQFTGRVNEVWVDINATAINGCDSINVSTY